MKINFAIPGTRGDVHNAIPAALELLSRNHTVTVISHKNFRPLFEQYNIPFQGISMDSKKLTQLDAYMRVMQSGGNNPWLTFSYFQKTICPHVIEIGKEIYPMCKGIDVLVSNHVGMLVTAHIAEALGIGHACITPAALGETKAYPSTHSGWKHQGHPLINKISHKIEARFFGRMCRTRVNELRTQILNLPPMPRNATYMRRDGKHTTLLLTVSNTVLPRPADLDSNVHILGCLMNNMAESQGAPKLSQKCREFIDKGTPPIYIGFGSANSAFDFDEVVRLANQLITETGRRVLLLMGWHPQGKHAENDNLLIADEEPHEVLFPEMELIVHHCGPSTLTNSLIAGKPSVLIPVLIDQFFWSVQAKKQGVAPQMIPFRKFSVKRVVRAVTHVLNTPQYAARAKQLQKSIQKERGERKAADVLEKLAR